MYRVYRKSRSDCVIRRNNTRGKPESVTEKRLFLLYNNELGYPVYVRLYFFLSNALACFSIRCITKNGSSQMAHRKKKLDV